MKVLFLTLLLGVVCAAQEEEAEQNLSELSGPWRTVYIGSTNPEKIQENGPFRTYFRKLVFDDEKGTVDFYFSVKRNGKWKNVHIKATKQDDGTYVADYEGQNVFKIVSLSRTHLVAHNTNVDKHGKKTELTGLFVKLNVEDEDLEKFWKLTEDKGIDKKNVVNFLENVKGSDIEDEALEKFKEFTIKRGIKEENIVHIKKSERVPETRPILVSMESRSTTRR
ncbi:hypothetical protein E5288_WYG020607 [Bos mutus]|uniref:Lipocalin/cytosolic fatty-acid binding domain-containing protein n=1 Tax=Bos mutus TaxID=72004 RepID=A0A6B0SB50_9CETA|nr:hypothetical protein [Bos mutus]